METILWIYAIGAIVYFVVVYSSFTLGRYYCGFRGINFLLAFFVFAFLAVLWPIGLGHLIFTKEIREWFVQEMYCWRNLWRNTIRRIKRRIKK